MMIKFVREKVNLLQSMMILTSAATAEVADKTAKAVTRSFIVVVVGIVGMDRVDDL